MKSEDHDIKETGSFNFGLCLGAIAGVVDAVALERAELGAATPFCPPGSVKVPELLRVVVAYLHARRDHKENTAAVLIRSALAAAYPCPH